MILAAAVCPYPPMLIPEVAARAAHELDEVRAACDEAVRTLLAADPERVIVLGAGGDAGWDESAGGSLAGFGVDVHAGGGTDELPLSLTVGAWLLDRAGWTGRRLYCTREPEVGDRDVVLAMADGSAKRTTEAPGFFDERAEGFDAAIAAALAAGDPAVLLGLDGGLGAELWAAGTETLRTLGSMTKGADITARLRCDVAPFGVGYWVADWVLR